MKLSTLAISKELEATGFTKVQADMMAEKLLMQCENSDLVTNDYLKAETENLVTKDYLKAEISDVRTEIAEIRTEMKIDIAGLETKIAELRTEMKTEIKDSKVDMVKWMIGLHFASFSATLTLLSGLIYFLLRY